MPPSTVDDYICEIREYLDMLNGSQTISPESLTQIEKVHIALGPFEKKMDTLENKMDIANEVEEMEVLLEEINPVDANPIHHLWVAKAQTRLYALQARVYELLDCERSGDPPILKEIKENIKWLSRFKRKGEIVSYFCTCRAIQLILEKEMEKIKLESYVKVE